MLKSNLKGKNTILEINSWAVSFAGEVWSLSSNWSKAKQENVDQKRGHR